MKGSISQQNIRPNPSCKSIGPPLRLFLPTHYWKRTLIFLEYGMEQGSKTRGPQVTYSSREKLVPPENFRKYLCFLKYDYIVCTPEIYYLAYNF
jgi:hypothetical protein